MSYSSQELYEGLVANKLIIPVGVPGIFGRGPIFEDVLARFDELVTRVAKDDGAEKMMFPPTLDKKVFEKVEYMDSFPQLSGVIYSFKGSERQALELKTKIHGGENWDGMMASTDCVLTPAACYPVYPSFAGTVGPEGRLVDMQNWVFRHEPSNEPTRMQAFRVREFVRVGTPDVVVQWRDMWLERGLQIMKSLGLPAKSDVASDPFFGRGGKMLAQNQKQARLKFEVLVPVISEENPTACCSFNWHQEHFGQVFDIKTPDGAVANTACLGFGMERVCMALFKHHGFDPKTWPAEVRSKLWTT
ncbi:MAG TPA: amino acid--[acyl-carrier-protein] ligase [Polyangiaceae bacterium]|jgi:seryl-tRNA synthetase|nr:amino acid--[acyl-carrier-protein] ligase [Polyangiaceae bacterium]